jgi:predicted RNA-binding protein with PIN domain
MSGFRGIWASVLSDAVAAGRGALRDLDGPEIPSSLQRVAAYSGGKLPPPLAVSLLAEIDRNDWFRDKVAETWEGDASSPAGLFLTRPDGWWIEIADEAAAKVSGRESALVADLRKQADKVEDKRRAAAKKAAEYKKALEKSKLRGKQRVETARRSVEAKFTAESAELASVRAEVASLAERLESLEMDHRELQDAYDGIRSRLAKARRQRMEESGSGATSRWAPSDPVKLARLLDLQAASLGRTPGQSTEPAKEHHSERLMLDAGIRPDSSDAIRWLVGLEDPAVVLVDGYNVQFHINRSDFISGSARRSLVDALKRLRTASTNKHRIVVVYDSTLPGERIARSSLGGVEVRFAEKDLIADEELVAMAGDLERVVVISSDREVREGSEGAGAVVLWSEAIAAWLDRS